MTSLIVSPSKSADNNKQLLSNYSFVLLICKKPNEERRAGLSSKVPEKIEGEKNNWVEVNWLVLLVQEAPYVFTLVPIEKERADRIRFYRPDRRATRQHKIIILVPDDVQGLAERISFFQGKKKDRVEAKGQMQTNVRQLSANTHTDTDGPEQPEQQTRARLLSINTCLFISVRHEKRLPARKWKNGKSRWLDKFIYSIEKYSRSIFSWTCQRRAAFVV